VWAPVRTKKNLAVLQVSPDLDIISFLSRSRSSKWSKQKFTECWTKGFHGTLRLLAALRSPPVRWAGTQGHHRWHNHGDRCAASHLASQRRPRRPASSAGCKRPSLARTSTCGSGGAPSGWSQRGAGELRTRTAHVKSSVPGRELAIFDSRVSILESYDRVL
jgi:hypothetical protein